MLFPPPPRYNVDSGGFQQSASAGTYQQPPFTGANTYQQPFFAGASGYQQAVGASPFQQAPPPSAGLFQQAAGASPFQQAPPPSAGLFQQAAGASAAPSAPTTIPGCTTDAPFVANLGSFFMLSGKCIDGVQIPTHQVQVDPVFSDRKICSFSVPRELPIDTCEYAIWVAKTIHHNETQPAYKTYMNAGYLINHVSGNDLLTKYSGWFRGSTTGNVVPPVGDNLLSFMTAVTTTPWLRNFMVLMIRKIFMGLGIFCAQREQLLVMHLVDPYQLLSFLMHATSDETEDFCQMLKFLAAITDPEITKKVLTVLRDVTVVYPKVHDEKIMILQCITQIEREVLGRRISKSKAPPASATPPPASQASAAPFPVRRIDPGTVQACRDTLQNLLIFAPYRPYKGRIQTMLGAIQSNDVSALYVYKSICQQYGHPGTGIDCPPMGADETITVDRECAKFYNDTKQYIEEKFLQGIYLRISRGKPEHFDSAECSNLKDYFGPEHIELCRTIENVNQTMGLVQKALADNSTIDDIYETVQDLEKIVIIFEKQAKHWDARNTVLIQRSSSLKISMRNWTPKSMIPDLAFLPHDIHTARALAIHAKLACHDFLLKRPDSVPVEWAVPTTLAYYQYVNTILDDFKQETPVFNYHAGNPTLVQAMIKATDDLQKAKRFDTDDANQFLDDLIWMPFTAIQIGAIIETLGKGTSYDHATTLKQFKDLVEKKLLKNQGEKTCTLCIYDTTTKVLTEYPSFPSKFLNVFAHHARPDSTSKESGEVNKVTLSFNTEPLSLFVKECLYTIYRKIFKTVPSLLESQLDVALKSYTSAKITPALHALLWCAAFQHPREWKQKVAASADGGKLIDPALEQVITDYVSKVA
jgi:hypothetical protein